MNRRPFIFVYLAGAAVLFLIALLIIEYRQLRESAYRLQLLQEQYYDYIETVKQVLKKQDQDDPYVGQELELPDEDEMDVDSFMVLDRTPENLKESTLNYLKDQKLDGLAKRINPHEWNNYTDQVLKGVHYQLPAPKNVRRKVARKETGWIPSKQRQASLTGILFSLPIEKNRFWLSSLFGARKKPNGQWGFHHGIDMAAQRGTPAKASAAGIVEQAGYANGYGNTVLISHDRVYKTRYAHLDVINVQVGQKVTKGQKIGAVGDTGFTRKVGKDASHLHFELYEHGKKINPLLLLSGDAP